MTWYNFFTDSDLINPGLYPEPGFLNNAKNVVDKETSKFFHQKCLSCKIYNFRGHFGLPGSHIRIRTPGPTESGYCWLLCCYPCMVVISEPEEDAARSLLEIADSAARWLADRCCPVTLISGGGSSCSMSRRIWRHRRLAFSCSSLFSPWNVMRPASLRDLRWIFKFFCGRGIWRCEKYKFFGHVWPWNSYVNR